MTKLSPPPPVRIPSKLMTDPELAAFFKNMVDTLYNLWFAGGGQQGGVIFDDRVGSDAIIQHIAAIAAYLPNYRAEIDNALQRLEEQSAAFGGVRDKADLFLSELEGIKNRLDVLCCESDKNLIEPLFLECQNSLRATGDLQLELGTLAAKVNGNIPVSLTSAVNGVLPASNGGQDAQPLIDYGGINANGTTTYYDGNALTGIADSKLGAFFIDVEFTDNAGWSGVVEYIINSTNTRFQLYRDLTGKIQVRHENAAGTQILAMTTARTPCADAGRYLIFGSFNLATAGTGRLWVNDVNLNNEAIYTDDTCDWTVTEYSIGASVGGTGFAAANFYTVWLDAATWIDFNNAAIRRKFYDINLVPNFLGQNGEFITGTPPGLFLAYDGSDAWHRNKGLHNSTAFTPNGTIADATTVLYGRDGGRIPRTITPTGTTGAQTINKRAGSVNFAAGAGSLVVTNNRVSQYSLVLPFIRNNDATMTTVTASAANGSFTLTPNLAPTAETRVDFIVQN